MRKLQSLLTHWGNNYAALLSLCAFFIILSLNIGVQAEWGVSVPFCDEWDADGGYLLHLWNAGALRLNHLIAPHNEHRILTERLWFLFLFIINDGWHPLLIKTANMFIRAISSGLIIYLLGKGLNRYAGLLFTGLAAILFVIPFSYQSILIAFLSQYFFLILFSILALMFTETGFDNPKMFIPALLFILLASLSLASGILVFLAIALTSLAFSWRRDSHRMKHILSFIICLTLFFIGFLLRVEVPYLEAAKAYSVGAFITSLLKHLSWPFIYQPALALPCMRPLLFIFALDFLKKT